MAHKIRCGSCKGVHASAAEVQDCHAEAAESEAQQAGEVYAEAVMSWVCGGGSPQDAGRYASVVASGKVWDGGVSDFEFSGQNCKHGLSVELCEGPQHYPMDM